MRTTDDLGVRQAGLVVALPRQSSGTYYRAIPQLRSSSLVSLFNCLRFLS